jgi:D-serine deaminase-like pyridoxal phosphate-dependent protein
MPAALPFTAFPGLDPARYALPAGELARLLTPALVIHLDRVRENLARVLACTGSAERWRPHVKTTKTPAVFAELLAAGLRQFKCATLREARWLLATGRERGLEELDLLVAYPLVGPALGELGRIAREHPRARLSVLCEDPAVLADVPPALGIFLDLDPGMRRTGIPIAERERIRALARAAGARLVGLHHYEGHLHGELGERRAQCFACYGRLLELAHELTRDGAHLAELVTSGTPAFLHALAFPAFLEGPWRHRVSPGTVVFHDLRTEEENPDLELVPAAVVLARVVSRPAADVVTCDAGSKSLAAEAGDPCAFVLGRRELVALAPSEEHLPFRVTAGAAPERGEVLTLVPRHVCPTVNLAEEAVLVEAGRVVGTAPVSARAHDLWARR